MKVKELMHSSFEAFFFLPFSLMICFNMFIISKKIFTTQKIKLCVLSNSNTTQKKKKLKTSKKSSLYEFFQSCFVQFNKTYHLNGYILKTLINSKLDKIVPFFTSMPSTDRNGWRLWVPASPF